MIAISLARVVLAIFFRIEVLGYDKIPASGGYLLASNHFSFWDPVLLAAKFRKRRIDFLAKAELFRFPLFGYAISAIGAIPVNRGARDVATIKNSVEHLKNGNIICVFPEGTRVRKGKKSMPKRGVVRMSQMANVPIIPVHIVGNYKLFSKMKLVVGNPVCFSSDEKISESQLLDNARTLMNTIYSL